MYRLKALMLAFALSAIFPGLVLCCIPVQQENEPTEVTVEMESVFVQLAENQEKVDLEAYVMGVVAGEMPASFDVEALKAQAVLARTYALKQMASGDKHPVGYLCTESSCCQAYAPDSITDIVTTAVQETAGQVLVYDGQLIEATYYSCSGGQTEDAQAVWGQAVPYLKALVSPGEEGSAHFVTTVKISYSDFFERLDADPSLGLIGEPVYTAGGGIESVAIGGKTFTGVQLRQLLGLKSTAIQMNIIGDQVIITTKGYGHRVGMSQYGAEAMAVSGNTFDQILAYYYPGTVLEMYAA